jgi:shikimate dehydrogenase
MAEISTKNACVIGYPIKHSRSPQLHGYWLDHYGIDGRYTAESIEPDNLKDFLTSLKRGELTYCGGNATIPHKEAVLALADHADDTARILGAANTYWGEAGALYVSNTDTYGFLANLDDQAPGWDEAETGAPKSTVVLGAGGASRAIVYGLMTRGFTQIILANRTVERAQSLARHFAEAAQAASCTIHPCNFQEAEEALPQANLLVNTTSLGMVGQDALAFSLQTLPATAVVTDIVYTPLETDLLKQARRRGNRAVDGLGMLLHQAVPGFEKWFGIRPEVTPALRNHVLQAL